MENEGYLCHHGVKGMKWGRRKDRNKGSSPNKAKNVKNKDQKIENNKDEKKSSNKPKKKLKDLTDQELQSKIRRLQMEKQYRDLKKDEVSAGKRLLGEILKTSGRMLGVQVANYVGGKAINNLFGDEVVKVGGKKKKEKSDSSSSNGTTANKSTTKSKSKENGKSSTSNKKDNKSSKSKTSDYNKKAYERWYNNAKKDPYNSVMKDVNKHPNRYAGFTNSVINSNKNVSMNTVLALPAPNKKRK